MEETAAEERVSVEGEVGRGDSAAISESEFSRLRLRLRERWELASVLNFLSVFEPVIGIDKKISAEEIEMGLIKPDKLLSQLHISLLKGIPPVSKTLDRSGAWVTVLCKKLAMWWPWVAEGKIPLTEAKGEERAKYIELDPTARLLLLRALCEIRADQYDAVDYINEALKGGTHISYFRKEKIGEDGTGIAYWYDGNAVTGHRLYREVSDVDFSGKDDVKGCLSIPKILRFQWETVATNLEEFRGVMDKFSSSKNELEVAVVKSVETDALPALEKLQKKKERLLKQKQRNEVSLRGLQNPSRTQLTRSCRRRGPVNYTFGDYDRAINDAIQVTMKRKSRDEEANEQNYRHKRPAVVSGGDFNGDISLSGGSTSRTSNEKLDGDSNHDDDSDDDYDHKVDSVKGENTDSSDSSQKDMSLGQRNGVSLPAGQYDMKSLRYRGCMRLAGISGHPAIENRNMRAKNNLRQRPAHNTALDSLVAPDSDDENSTHKVVCDSDGHSSEKVVPDSDDETASRNTTGSLSPDFEEGSCCH